MRHSHKGKTKQYHTKVLKADELGWNPEMSACKCTSHICNIQESTMSMILDFLDDKRRYSLFSYVIPLVVGMGVGWEGQLDE